jgi:hypothetical protein
MLLEHIPSIEALFEAVARTTVPGGIFAVRTMLPDDIKNTTWYRYLPQAMELELARTPRSERVIEVAEESGLTLWSLSSYTDSVDHDVSVLLPQRIRDRAFQILWRIEPAQVLDAASRIECDLEKQSWVERMSASLFVFRR